MLRSTALAAAPARHPLLLLRRPSLVSGGRQASLSLAPRFPPAQTHGGGHGSAAQPSWVAAAKKEGKAPGRRGSKQAPSPAQKPAAAVQDPRSEELCLACEQGDLEGAKELLSACANYHACNKAGHFALSLAARGGHLAVVRELLERGAHVDRPPGSRGFTALRAAAGRKGNVEVLRELLRRGAQVDMAASSGSDPDKEEQDGDGDDADDAFLKLLLRDGNTGRPEAGTTPLMAACLCSDVEMVRLLLDPGGASPHAKNQQGITPLHRAAAAEGSEVVKELLSRGVKADEKCSDGATPLYVAALFGRLDTAKLLLSHGADPEVKDNEGFTAVHWAAGQSDARLLEALLGAGAKADVVGERGPTPLMLAATEGTFESVQLLLRKGARANAKGPGGVEAIHLAAMSGDAQAVEALLDAGADPNEVIVSDSIRNKYDDDFWKQAKLLGPTPLHFASSPDVARLLLQRKASLAACDVYASFPTLDGRRPLHYVAAEGRAEVVKVLAAVDKGINKADNNGVSPLHMAAGCGHAEAVRALVAGGADPHAKDKEGDTPLYLAAREGHEEAARALLEAGANPQQGNQYGMTALEVAPKGSAVAQLLTQHMQKATQKQKDDKKQKQQKRKP